MTRRVVRGIHGRVMDHIKVLARISHGPYQNCANTMLRQQIGEGLAYEAGPISGFPAPRRPDGPCKSPGDRFSQDEGRAGPSAGRAGPDLVWRSGSNQDLQQVAPCRLAWAWAKTSRMGQALQSRT